MITLEEKSLSATNLMRLYGRIPFTWDLMRDTILWKGPINQLFSSDAIFLTGSSYLHRTTVSGFWERFRQIEQRTGDTYTVSYPVVLPNQSQCLIEEEAVIIRNNQGLACKLEGTLRVCAEVPSVTSEHLQGYENLTGLPFREVLLENLTCLVEQTRGESSAGGYLVFAVDKLSLIYFLFGMDVLRQVVQKVGARLSEATRFYDVIGRISGCCYGVILKDTDECGVFEAPSRLVSACQEIEIPLKDGMLKPSLSAGGAAFREQMLPLELMNAAEEQLFSMQNLKGAGIYVPNKEACEVGSRRRADRENDSKSPKSKQIA
jgi:diguanylate cyclase (GGDEF)-like protein